MCILQVLAEIFAVLCTLPSTRPYNGSNATWLGQTIVASRFCCTDNAVGSAPTLHPLPLKCTSAVVRQPWPIASDVCSLHCHANMECSMLGGDQTMLIVAETGQPSRGERGPGGSC